MKNDIFSVDVKGLRQLHEGKPKWFILRELIQNAMDENITQCNVFLNYRYGKAEISVEDDSPEGFRDLSDAYTLFKETYKRSDVKKRGRFNFGEKQVLCMADTATIVSTKGSIFFDVLKGERSILKKKRRTGSQVTVVVKMSRDEYKECCDYCSEILIPRGVKVMICIDGVERELEYKTPHLAFNALLKTEAKENDAMRVVHRETSIHLHKPANTAYIYELGIPVCEIDCDYSIDVQQKVPLSTDRDKVDAKYLKTLFGEVVNHVISELRDEQSSNIWVREAFTSDRSSIEVKKEILTKRLGDKALIATPNDARSMDEAISNNFNIVYGREMNKDEWEVVRENGLMISTSEMFKVNFENAQEVNPNEEEKALSAFCIRVAKDLLDLDIRVVFVEAKGSSTVADFTQEDNLLRFNVGHSKLPPIKSEKGFISQPMLNLVIHELGHSCGWHYEHSYHECITLLGSKMIEKALEDKDFFKL